MSRLQWLDEVTAALKEGERHSPRFVRASTHTHNRFTALLEFLQDYPGEQVPERQNQEG